MLSLIPYGRRDTNLFSWMDDMENLFSTNVKGGSRFRCDIVEKEGNYRLQAELPGFGKEDIQLELEGNTLTIQAKHKEETEEKDEAGRFVRRERRYGSFSRSFDITGIDKDKIKADYANGVLEVNMPALKKEEKLPEVRRIEIGG